MANDDRVYEAYIGKMGEKFQKETKERIDWIIEQVADAGTVLDVGCSQGIVSLILAQNGKVVTGVDIQQEAIEYAKELQKNAVFKNSYNVNFMCGDIIKMDFEKKFDCIVITEVIEHLDNPIQILEHLYNLLEDYGKIIISVPFGLSKHHDHKRTYYLGNFVRLISSVYNINKIEFMGNWIGAICEKSIELAEAKDVISQYEPMYEMQLEERENAYVAKYEDVVLKHKKAVDDYYTIKEWLNNSKLGCDLLETEKNALETEKKEILDKYNKSKNDYYTIKEWLQADKERIKALEDERKTLLDKYNKTKTDYYTMKKWFEEKSSRVKDLENHEQEMLKMISDYAILEQESQCVIKKAKNTIQKQKKEIKAYKIENEKYQRIMDKIKNTWYGKIALKGYKMLKKMKIIA